MVQECNVRAEPPEADYFSELYNISTLFATARKLSGKQTRQTISIATQNLMGFAKKARRHWFSGWKRHRGRTEPDIIMVQDARLHTVEQVQKAQRRWSRTWQRTAPEHPLSY